jgi:hypothetical protein
MTTSLGEHSIDQERNSRGFEYSRRKSLFKYHTRRGLSGEGAERALRAVPSLLPTPAVRASYFKSPAPCSYESRRWFQFQSIPCLGYSRVPRSFERRELRCSRLPLAPASSALRASGGFRFPHSWYSIPCVFKGQLTAHAIYSIVPYLCINCCFLLFHWLFDAYQGSSKTRASPASRFA